MHIPGPHSRSEVLSLRHEQLNLKLAPSQMDPEAIYYLQRNDNKNRILCNCPPHFAPTVPVVLLHPLLTEFSHDYENHVPRKEDHRFAQDLLAMSSFYCSEDQRQT